MKKTISIILAAILLILSFAACGAPENSEKSEKSESAKGGIYNFEDYKSSEVFDIEKIKLSDGLAEKCVTYKFSYLSDGGIIKAYISIPNSAAESGKPYKCILYNRGGNKEIGMLTDNSTANMCAVLDYIVIASQYRGTDGSEMADQFGGDDLHDVIKLIDLCQNKFSFVDMTDFCVAGESRGGMMTYMTARQDSRVKRIIAVSALSDLFKGYDERKDMQDVIYSYIGGTPQEKKAEYEKRSAIYWADEIKVPVLIIHSKKDKQVSFKQAEEMYAKLKKTTDCTFITHDDDVHGIHKEDLKTITDWLNKTTA